MQATPFTVAEESLGASSAMQGIGGMERTAAPKGPNMFDSGAASKVQVNTQPFNNERLLEQNIMQNTASAAQQANSNAVQQVRKQQLVQDNAEYKAQAMLQQRTGEVLSVMGAPATLAMGNMSPPQAEKLRSDVAVQKAMTMGVAPELVQEQLSARRYG